MDVAFFQVINDLLVASDFLAFDSRFTSDIVNLLYKNFKENLIQTFMIMISKLRQSVRDEPKVSEFVSHVCRKAANQLYGSSAGKSEL